MRILSSLAIAIPCLVRLLSLAVPSSILLANVVDCAVIACWGVLPLLVAIPFIIIAERTHRHA